MVVTVNSTVFSIYIYFIVLYQYIIVCLIYLIYITLCISCKDVLQVSQSE